MTTTSWSDGPYVGGNDEAGLRRPGASGPPPWESGPRSSDPWGSGPGVFEPWHDDPRPAVGFGYAAPGPVLGWRPRPSPRTFGERAQAGLNLALRSVLLLRAEPGLLAVPIVSTALVAGVGALAYVVGRGLPHVLAVGWAVAVLVVLSGINVGGQAVIVQRVGTVLHGRRCTNRQAFAAVVPHWRTLLGWGAVTFVVGQMIRTLENRKGVARVLLRLVAAGLTVAWSALALLVLPVILFEGLGVRAAVRRAAALAREHWGEDVVYVGALAAVAAVGGPLVVASGVGLTLLHLQLLAYGFVAAGMAALYLLSAVATPVAGLLLYEYATAGRVGSGLREADLVTLFEPRRA